MRKKTDNRDVAKRAKNLVKRWQALISSPAAAVNGDGIAARSLGGAGVGPSSKPASPALSRLSPASTGSSKPVSPALPRLSPKTGLSPKLATVCPKLSSQKQVTTLNGQSCVSPLLRTVAASCSSTGRTVSPHSGASLSGSSNSTSPRSNHISHSHGKSNNHHPGQSYAPPRNTALNKSEPIKTNSNGSAGQTLSKTNAANKKRRRTPDPNSPSEIPSKKQSVGPDGVRAEQNGVKSTHASLDQLSSVDSVKLKRISSTPEMLNGVISDRRSGLHGKPVYMPGTKSSGPGVGALPHDARNELGRVDSPSLSSQHSGASTSPCTPLVGRSTNDSAHMGFSAKRNVSLLLKTPDQSDNRSDKSGSCKTPKVKTTAQLIAELQAKSGAPGFGSATMSKISRNQIEKEPDDILQPVVPASAKPRPRRKPGSVNELLPPSTPTGSLSQTKTEMVRKFLQTSITPSSTDSDLASPFSVDHHHQMSPSLSSSHHRVNISSADHNTESLSDVEVDVECLDGGPMADSTCSVAPSTSWAGLDTRPHSPPLVNPEPPSSMNMNLEDIYSQLPPLNLDEIDLEDDGYSDPNPVDVTQGTLDRLENDKWEGVNGTFNSEDHRWNQLTETYPSTSYDGQPIYILPYVNIDD